MNWLNVPILEWHSMYSFMGHFVAYLNIQYKLVLSGHISVQFSSSVVSDSLPPHEQYEKAK